MYRYICGFVILALFTWFIQLLRSGRLNLGEFKNHMQHQISASFKHIGKFSLEGKPLFTALRSIFYVLTAILFLVLAITGIFPVLAFGMHLSSLLLIIHVTAAPFFVFSLMALILLQAHRHQYDDRDLVYLQAGLKREDGQDSGTFIFWKKTYFWLFSVFSIPAVMSMLVSMYPLFGTEGQILLLDIHRYSVLILFVMAALYVFSQYSLQNNDRTADQTAVER